MTSSIKNLYSLSVILILLAVSVFLYQKPYYNWDMFPYMALAAQNSSMPFDSTHTFIYKVAVANMTKHDFEAISQRQPVLMNNSAEFQSILKYFEIKPGYNLTVRLFHSLGFNLVAATYLPSIIGYFLIGCIMLMWMRKMIPSPYSAFTSLLLMASPFLVTTARYSSPDMLCALFSFAGLYIMIESSVVIGLIVSLIAITIRPDTIILYLFMTFAFEKSKRLTPSTASWFRALAILTTFFTLKGPGILMDYLFTNPDSQNSGSLIQNYGSSLVGGFNSMLSSQLLFFTFIAIITLFLTRKSGQDLFKDVWPLLILGVIGSFVVRYFLHPDVEDRFLISGYLIIIIGFCRELSILLLPKQNVL